MKFLKYLLLLISIHIYAADTIKSYVLIGQNYAQQTIGSNLFQDVAIKRKLMSFSALVDFKEFQFYASYKHSPYQQIGSGTLNNDVQIDFFQKAYQLETGFSRKFYLSDNFFIAPALIYFHTAQHNTKKISIQEIQKKKVDQDLRPYLYMRYRVFKSTVLYTNIQLDNDLTSNDNETEYNQYPFSIALYQSITPKIFLHIQYQQNLKDRPIFGSEISDKQSKIYTLGIGFEF
ncbi:MAG: hypothetical protein ACI9TV_001737 [Sulfurimonas sp.]|uniref:hypothetical protein n=1 Tax=Sulfurimonas sp. TaxID=2022749 RepID=UPI0039E69A33